MTTRRRSGRRSGTRKRAGRNVWVNENINSIMTANSVLALNCLTDAKDFMTFDTTIVQIIIPDFSIQFLTLVSDSIVNWRGVFQTAPTLMETDKFQVPFADSVGAPWMGTMGGHAYANPGPHDIVIAGGGNPALRFQAKRRFRENDSTLVLMMQLVHSGGDIGSVRISGFIRTLLHIP